MIPYWNFHLFNLPILNQPIEMFGVLVALGVLLGDWLSTREGVKRGLEARDVKYLNIRIIIGGFIMAHLVSVIFYFPDRIKENPAVLLYIWSGLSSYGGFLGAAIAFVWLTRRHKIPALPYADAVALGLAPAWILGRIGCFTAHDHPGAHTDFFLAVQYPGGARHDLGLYEAFFAIALTAILFLVARRPRRAGTIIGLTATLYAPVRFAFDFLRATDVARPDTRYGGLTPAQWACVACLALGIYLLNRARTQPRLPAKDTAPAAA